MTYPVLRTLLVVFVALVVGGATGWTALRPSRPTTRLGMRGLKRQQALLRRPLWAGVEPFVRWMGVRVGPWLSPSMRIRLENQITYAGDFLGLVADEYVGCMVALGGLGAAIGAFAAYELSLPFLWLPAIVCAGIGASVPHLVVDSAKTERLKAINRGLPAAIDLMALSMSAGRDFQGSIQQVVEKVRANEALREELAYLLQQLQVGRTRAQALRELVSRAPVDSVREFVQALIQAEERGNPVAAVLEVQATTSRMRRSNLAENAANDMRGKMILPTMMMVGVSLMLIAVPSAMMLEKFSGGMK